MTDQTKPASKIDPSRPRRFKTSGNPAGRPKGSRNRKTIMKEIAFERQPITENSKVRSAATLELVVLRLKNLALEGKSLKAIEAYQKLEETYLPQATGKEGTYLVAPALISEADYIAEMEKKNRETPRPRLRHGVKTK